MRIVLALVAVALLSAGYFWLVLTWSYSTGERADWIQKLSKKGWVCKTWEGELAMKTISPCSAPGCSAARSPGKAPRRAKTVVVHNICEGRHLLQGSRRRRTNPWVKSG